jgi:hypothetical protein
MGDGRLGFVLCICARRGPCALDTIPLAFAPLKVKSQPKGWIQEAAFSKS